MGNRARRPVHDGGSARTVSSPIPVAVSLDDETVSGIADIGITTTIFHFLEFQAKYKASFVGDESLNTVEGMANPYFSRSWGLSYRYKYMEDEDGSTNYHLLGLSCAF